MSELVERMVDILSEDIGHIVARGSIATYLRQIGIAEEAVAREHLPLFAEKLEPGLCVFVGAKKAAALTRRIREIGTAAS